jgi:hypothetical protein
MVVRAPAGPVELTVGGVPPRTTAGTVAEEVRQGYDGGTAIGKRYTDADGAIELLCIKAGKGVPALAGVPLSIKTAKPLPSSD